MEGVNIMMKTRAEAERVATDIAKKYKTMKAEAAGAVARVSLAAAPLFVCFGLSHIYLLKICQTSQRQHSRIVKDLT